MNPNVAEVTNRTVTNKCQMVDGKLEYKEEIGQGHKEVGAFGRWG